MEVDGTDFLASYDVMGRAVEHVRARHGPVFVRATVTGPTRTRSRTTSGCTRRARSASRKPPGIRLLRMVRMLTGDGVATDAELSEIAASVDREVQEATNQALAAPKPARDTAGLWVFSPDVDPTADEFAAEPQTDGKPDTMVSAINRTLHDEMARSPHIVVFGEDVADSSDEAKLATVPGKGGVFKVTHGLQKAHGGSRVFNSPLAEANIIGRAVGMALRGHQAGRGDSVLRLHLAGDDADPRRDVDDALPVGQQLLVPDGHPRADRRVPARRRAVPQPVGREHLRPLPGDPNRVSVERRRCGWPAAHRDPVRRPGDVPRAQASVPADVQQGRRTRVADFTIPFGRGALRREGSDVLVVTWGALVQRTLLAAQQAEKEGLSVAVLDLRTIIPYDWAGISAQVQRCNRVVIAHEDQLTCGFGAEIAARIADELFHWLDAPVRRVAAMDTPVAYLPGPGRGNPAAVSRRSRGDPGDRPLLSDCPDAGTDARRSAKRSGFRAVRDRSPAAALAWWGWPPRRRLVESA